MAAGAAAAVEEPPDEPTQGAAREVAREDSIDKIERHAAMLSSHLQTLRERINPPRAEKTLRTFPLSEVAQLTGIPESTLRHMSNHDQGPSPVRLENRHRAYTLAQVNELRRFGAEQRPDAARTLLPHRRGSEHLQILAVTNFKGGSAKTTTSVHLAHYLALHGYRVLAIDLDPQASLSAMFGAQPELDVQSNETVYAALRYDDERRPVREVIRPTYFDGLDLIPGNLEVMEFEHHTPRAAMDRQPGEPIFFERLRIAIDEVADDYDVVVLDTPPSLGYLTLAALYAATGMIVTVHPAMLDVASMNQFLIMMSDLGDVIRGAGAGMDKDFMQYLVTRHDPNDNAQLQIVGRLRHLFGSDVIAPTALQSTAVEAAGLAKRTIYEMEPGHIQRATLKRARAAQDAVNEAILDLMRDAWGRT